MSPNWAEIIESISTLIGAIAAIIAGFYAIKAYKSNNEDINKQIAGLKHANDLNKKRLELEFKKRRTDIMPSFIISGNDGNILVYTINFLNQGFIAINLRIEQINKIENFIIEQNIKDEIKKQEGFSIIIRAKDEVIHLGNTQINLKLFYEDIDKNKYEQLLFGKYNNFKLSQVDYL